MLGHSPIFPRFARRSALFVPHSQYRNSASSTAISFEVRPYPVLTQSYFERVERDPILNMVDVHHARPCPFIPFLIRFFSVSNTSITFFIRGFVKLKSGWVGQAPARILFSVFVLLFILQFQKKKLDRGVG